MAPTASIINICGRTSACSESSPANIYTHKTHSGSFVVKNPHLEKLLQEKSKDSANVWNTILEKGGSVQHLDFLTPEEKDAFKTSFEIDQRSEEHTSELQSLMRISYAVFCLNKKHLDHHREECLYTVTQFTYQS